MALPRYSQGRYPDSKVRGANMGAIWGRQDPGGPHVGPMIFAIWVYQHFNKNTTLFKYAIKIQSEIAYLPKFDVNRDMSRGYSVTVPFWPVILKTEVFLLRSWNIYPRNIITMFTLIHKMWALELRTLTFFPGYKHQID